MIICTVCPNGCVINENDDNTFSGARCPRGELFAQNELVEPQRVLTTTVKTTFNQIPVLPVKTDKPIPKSKIHDVMTVVNGITVTEPLKVGDVVYENVLDGVNLVSTLNMNRRL